MTFVSMVTNFAAAKSSSRRVGDRVVLYVVGLACNAKIRGHLAVGSHENEEQP